MSVKDGGRIDLDREEEPAADARNAGVASMVNFLMPRPPARIGREA